MKNSFLKTFIDTALGMLFFFILPLVSLIALPEIVYRISGNVMAGVWTTIIYGLLLFAFIITLFRMDHER